MFEASLFSAFLLGLSGAAHCIGMCGGIISGLSMASQQQQWQIVATYQIGRIISYSLIGLLGGALGSLVGQHISFPLLPILSGLLLISMGLYISRLWLGLTYLERLGKMLWRFIQPLSRHVLPVKTSAQAFFLGGLWGWLPCGLVYSALGYAVTTGKPLNSAIYMLFFGLGTLPATFVAGAASSQLKVWLNQPWIRTLSAVLFIGFGAYVLGETMIGLFSSAPAQHHH